MLGICIGAFLYWIGLRFYRCRMRERTSREENPAPQTASVDTAYEEINLPNISAAKSFEPTGSAENENESNYKELNTVRDKENLYCKPQQDWQTMRMNQITKI